MGFILQNPAFEGFEIQSCISGILKMAISLEKLEKEAPKLIDLAKKADISLKKANLSEHNAKVALCLDISGSMSQLYYSGKIQQFAEKILALGCRFDDDGSIDIFLFGANAHIPGEMTLQNFNNFIGDIQQKYPLEGGTYYGKVMKTIRNFYFPQGKGGTVNAPVSSNKPIYVMFVTDGATGDESLSEQQLKWSSYEPIFWQFMAIGKSNRNVKKGGIKGFFSKLAASDFSFLEGLDDLRGRYLDNSDFFSVEDPEAISNQDLYDLLMTEYPNWVKAVQSKGLLK
ncbi:VWA domain-containing protein [Lusitaniella coriacea]|uniref:VWA domain-containing protein n=1 Tax=Lusitaniella coriacea TaxID=1983105 RepID=UPI003CF1D9EA